MSWLFWYCVISHCFFTLILYKLTENLNNYTVEPPNNVNVDCFERKKHSKRQNTTRNLDKNKQESSIWCFGQERSERICKFRNLYYSPTLGEYLFFHGESSIVQGVPKKRCSPALLDLSSIKDHNLQYFNYQDAPITALKHFPHVVVFDGPTLLFHRFNPENIMHVIHDDLLPLFYTLRQYFPNFGQRKPFNTDVQIAFMDGRGEGSYFELYKLFSNRKPILSTNLSSRSNNTLICFTEVTVGISKSTTWYDYGFHIPQGPIPNSTADGATIQKFTEYVTNKLEITSRTTEKSDYIILFSRESNRLILNEFELIFTIATTFNLRVVRLSLENDKLGEIIRQIQGSRGIIGIHGSILVLSMFLPADSFVIELFPYAINPQNYTPYKTLAEILHLSYSTWENKMKNNTVTYPNRTKLEGGILHLDTKMQKLILQKDKVPQHLCCDDPYWLFRIYQDTFVDIPSFIEVMRNSLNLTKATHNTDYIRKYPGKIKSVSCENLESVNGAALLVSWTPSWNMQFFYTTEVTYEVWIQDVMNDNYMAYSLPCITKHTFGENIKYDTSYSVWVRGVINGNTGPFSNDCKCSTY